MVPTRFGLKYAPVPTLALEYEDDLNGVVNATAENSTSLYEYRDDNGASVPTRKLHVVELPMLTKTSETGQITRQLQQDNGRFLAPGVVSETQLKRLLDRLVQNLPNSSQMDTNDNHERQSLLATAQMDTNDNHERQLSLATAQMDTNDNHERQLSLATARQDEGALKEEESDLEESMMEESVVEESVVEASKSDEYETLPPRAEAENERDKSSDNETEATTTVGAAKVEEQDEHEDSHENPPPPTDKEKDEGENESEEDAKKTQALRSESDVSEEEVLSEELEYFSEDGSEEDSF